MPADEILLLDMLLAARDAEQFLRDTTAEQFRQDRLRQLAIIKSIEIIGEAATKISGPFKELHPEIAWRDIIDMRHRLVHGYREIDLGRVWRTVHEDLPALIAALERLVPPEDD